MVDRVYVEKKPGFDGEAQALLKELQESLGVAGLTNVRLFNRYDCEGLQHDTFETCVPLVFSEPQSDNTYDTLPEVADAHVFATEFLPGQFDQRADSASECIQLITQKERPTILCAQVYLLEGDVSYDELDAIKNYVINPVEARLASLDTKTSLAQTMDDPDPVEILTGFTSLSQEELQATLSSRGLAMDLEDITFFQSYFASEKRDPTIAELKTVDTYWSDHCRHTTFETELDNIAINDDVVKKAFNTYLEMRHELDRDHKKVCLMDMATTGARYLEKTGKLTTLDKSDEINACTVIEKVDVDGKEEDWLFLFKNETHNHPTEIEPFGGAATCIGGAIRDPLSGRSYVYQAMRVTGAGEPLTPITETIEGKLPQSKLTVTAAQGYSSYGNQIGLATGQVSELYHPGYVAKRMEIGAVVGATPKSHVRREQPKPGDVVVLLGGRTGRDGIGGATGSSKAHDHTSLEACGAEVQKGNAPIERKLQRLFRREDACKLIVRCNDFGAGGVSVAIGELADGLEVNLDAVPKKYEGLDGCELAISESQERMAVVLNAQDVDTFLGYAHEENLEATPVAVVTELPRLVMKWRGDTVVDISREFLNTNGAPKHQAVLINKQKTYCTPWADKPLDVAVPEILTNLNCCSTKGLGERFDSTIGAATVLMPYGGKTQLTPVEAMVAKMPVDTETTTCSGMAWGFNPYLMEKDQFRGAYLSVVESLSKLFASGFKRKKTYLTFQEYFQHLEHAPERWGKPAAALLGALMAQKDFEVGAIGGKDSMSGSFEELHVPPTLVSFATALGHVDNVVSPEFKAGGSNVYWIRPKYEDALLPEKESQISVFNLIQLLIENKAVSAVATESYGCGIEALFKMCVGNTLGLHVNYGKADELTLPYYGSFFVETTKDLSDYTTEDVEVLLLGTTTNAYELSLNDTVFNMAELQEMWESKLEPIFPYRHADKEVPAFSFSATEKRHSQLTLAHPRVIIPIFPGTNCEFDTKRAFERAGAHVTCQVIKNLSPQDCIESVELLAKNIAKSQIVMLPGGFSGGDEPDGSAKFITAFFRNPLLTEAIRKLLHDQDGLMLGICNGFQALIKLGLVPFGDIRPMDDSCPTLTFNKIHRHQSGLVRTRIASTLSPWLSKTEVGDIHTVAISHGEGRFVASNELIEKLAANGQICTQYCDLEGKPGLSLGVNPNGSTMAIEGICSPCGRVFGKMGHSERSAYSLYKNVEGNKHQPIIEGGVSYFTD